MKVSALFALALVACSSASPGGPSSPSDPSPPPSSAPPSDTRPPPEADAAPPFAPAAHAALPQVVSQGGPVYASPKFIGVTFAGDALQSQIDDFMSKIGASTYWATVMKDYGVGPGTSKMIHLTEAAPASIDDAQIITWLQQKLAAANSDLGAPDPAAIYTLFYPETTAITEEGGKACQDFGGYHYEATVGSTKVSYAVIPRCKDFAGLSGIDMVTAAVSHELAEASSDPHPDSEPAFSGTDAANGGWGLVMGGENADMCAMTDKFSLKPQELGFVVSKIWSNTAAKAGTDPCVPSDTDGPYFNASAALSDEIDLQGPTPQDKMIVKGLKMAVGASKSFELDLFSDKPTAEWQLSAVDMALNPPDILDISFDKPHGKNGDKVTVTIKLLQKPQEGMEPFMIQSKLGDTMNFWVGVVGE